ncbi:DUF397 domain-containing protein [Streptosporangium longisporum]|uniref:DUF397 domain-containing protein n=1 Tax=Streptosporangium longisporum TaxID=46187 RepID=UPI0031EE3215
MQDTVSYLDVPNTLHVLHHAFILEVPYGPRWEKGWAVSDVDLSRVIWRKSQQSATNGNCVEVAHLHGRGFAVRDSKDRGGPSLVIDARGWAAFVTAVKDGRFDVLPGADAVLPGAGATGRTRVIRPGDPFASRGIESAPASCVAGRG